MQSKKVFVKYLLIAAALLLVINVAVDLFIKPGKEDFRSELSVRQIDSVFFAVLSDYGIEESWITRKRATIPDEDSIDTQLIVKIPADLPIPLIIRDINNIIEKDITGFVSEEKKIFGATEIRIYSNEYLKLKAELIPDAATIRVKNELAFIISNKLEPDESEFLKFLEQPYPLAIAVVPGTTAAAKTDSIDKYAKQFVALINDDIAESNLKLTPGFQKELLRNSINNIIKLMAKARFIAIDETSRIFNSTVYNFVRDEFAKRNRPLVNLSEFIYLDDLSDEELISKFNFYCADTTGVDQKIFYTTFDNFLKLIPALDKARRKGNRVIPLSQTYLVREKLEKN